MLRKKIKDLIIGRKGVLIPNRISIFANLQWFFVSQLRFLLSLVNLKKRYALAECWRTFDKTINREVVIIAGGPSFTKELAIDLINRREQFDIVALNYYCLTDYSEKLIPDYYVLSDSASIRIDKNVAESKSRALITYLERYRPKLCVPYGDYWDRLKGICLRFDDVENLYANNVDPRYPRGYTSNTTFKAIALMLKVGYEKIYIMGLDYDYPRKMYLDESNHLFIREEHHYGNVDIDHSNFYDSVGHALHWLSQDYWHLRKLSSTKVVNVTKTSLIDAFARVTPEKFME